MECLYINVDTQIERRNTLEQNFSTYALPGWSLTRVGAVPLGRCGEISGGLRDAEKSCFLSHRKAVEQCLLFDGHSLILEDDAMLGPRSCERINGALRTVPADGWDLIFTDISIYDVTLMSNLLFLRRNLGPERLQLVDLKELPFCAACAYIVNERSKEKVLGLLETDDLNVQYDIRLRQLIHAGQLRAFVTFPFCTSMSAHAEQTQIQFGTDMADLAYSAFRRLAWIHRDLEVATAPLDRLPSGFVDDETRAFSRIVAAAMSTNMTHK